jgi:toxin ParE1/3/4
VPRGYEISAQAEDDLLEIWRYIARDSDKTADRFLDRLNGKFVALARNPHTGRARPDLRPDLRSFPYGAYLILYRIVGDGAEIVRVVHAARNLDDLI